MMAKFGPFCRNDNCSVVRGVLDRLITHLLVWSVHVSLELEGGSLGAGLGAGAVLVEGVGAMGVAGTVDWVEMGVGSPGKTGWHIAVSTQSVLLVNVLEIYCLPGEIMMVSITFEIKPFELIKLSSFCFIMPMFFYSVDKQFASF